MIILKKTNTFFDVIFAILVASIPLSMAIPNIALILLILAFFIKLRKGKSVKAYPIFVSIFVFFFVLKALFFGSFLENLGLYKHLLSMVLLVILTLEIENTKLVKKGFVIGVSIAVIISVVQIVLFYISNKTIPLGNTEEAGALLLGERPYLGFMCFIAVVIVFDFLVISKTKQIKWAYVFLLILLSSFIFLIVARLSILLIALFFIMKTIQYFGNLTLKGKFLTGLIFLLFVIFILTNKNFKERLHIENNYNETLAKVKNQEPRFVIWNCSFSQINNREFSMIFGFRNNKIVQRNLNDCYEESIENTSKRNYFLEREFNTHNQFIDLFLQGGIFGLLCLIALFFKAFIESRKGTQGLIILFAFIAFMMFENIFHRQVGVYLFAIFIPLFFNKKNLVE